MNHRVRSIVRQKRSFLLRWNSVTTIHYIPADLAGFFALYEKNAKNCKIDKCMLKYPYFYLLFILYMLEWENHAILSAYNLLKNPGFSLQRHAEGDKNIPTIVPGVDILPIGITLESIKKMDIFAVMNELKKYQNRPHDPKKMNPGDWENLVGLYQQALSKWFGHSDVSVDGQWSPTSHMALSNYQTQDKDTKNPLLWFPNPKTTASIIRDLENNHYWWKDVDRLKIVLPGMTVTLTWKVDKKTGKIIMRWTKKVVYSNSDGDESEYIGTFVRGRLNGENCKWITRSKIWGESVREGLFVDGRLHGKWKIRHSWWIEIEGTFKNGELVQWSITDKTRDDTITYSGTFLEGWELQNWKIITKHQDGRVDEQVVTNGQKWKINILNRWNS